MTIKQQLKEGITLDNSLNAVYAGETQQIAKNIVDFMIHLHATTDKPVEIKVNNRIYIISQDYVKYYSLSGVGKYYYINDWKQVYNFLTKPVKTPRKIKLLTSTEKELNRQQKKKISV